VNAERAEEKQRPAAANGDAAKRLVAMALFEEDAAAEKRERHGIQDEGFSGWAEILKGELAEQSQADHGHDHAEDGEPTGAERFLDGGDGYLLLLKGWRGRGNAKG